MGRASRAHPTGCGKRQAGLTAKPSKCCWGVASLSYLGHVVRKGKVTVPEYKVKSIRAFVKPVTKKDLQSFLDTTGYYRKFIQNYSLRAHSLTEATKKAAPAKIMWSDDMYDAFLYLCRALSDCCMLHIPVSCNKFLLQTDAQEKELALFSASSEMGNTSFFSTKLKPAETRYSATELECLVNIRAVEYFAVYLTGRSFTVQTDHRALQFLQQSRYLNGRLTWWAWTLQQYMSDIQYRPGNNNGNADGLSHQAQSPDEGAWLFEEGVDGRPQTWQLPVKRTE